MCTIYCVCTPFHVDPMSMPYPQRILLYTCWLINLIDLSSTGSSWAGLEVVPPAFSRPESVRGHRR